MWKNHIKITLRNISRNKSFNFINIAGLAIGLASSIFIILYIIDQVKFDRFHEKGDNIYRLYIEGKMSGEELKGAWNSPVFGPTFYEEVPEIINVCRFDFRSNLLMYSDPSDKHLENHIMYADSGFFEIFSFRLIEGDPATCLDEPNSILISEKKVPIYFPEGDPVGKAISMNNDSTLYTVTGVVENAPENSHIFYDFIASYSTLTSSRRGNWFNNHMVTYFLIRDEADPTLVEDKINVSLLEHIRPLLIEFLGITVEEFEASGNKYGLFLQHLYDIHLDPTVDMPNEIGFRPLGNRGYLYIFGVIAFFILVIASINFMNMSTARSLTRAKEVSLRKVVGSSRKELVHQFLAESVVLSFVAMIIAILIVVVLLPNFNQITGIELGLKDLFSWYMFPAFIVLSIFLGLLSGLYPASVLASFKPLQALKGKATASNGTGRLRSILVIVQFTISVVIMVGTMVIFWQFRYMLNKDIGFNKDNMIIMDRVYPLGNDRLETFKAELMKHNSIESVSNSTAFLGSPNNNNGYKIREKDDTETFLFNTYWVDYDFMDCYGLEFANPESRYMSKDFGADSSVSVINEAAVRKYMIEDPLNSTILWPNDDNTYHELKVIGVLKDFHYSSVKNDIAPLVAFLKPNDWNWVGYLNVRVKPGSEHRRLALDYMEETWNDFTDKQPFQYIFLDEHYDSFYAEEKRTGIITFIFSILSVFIACLGLFGMTLYNTQRRTREIGIRKVMGATENKILVLVSKSILFSLVFSILIAWPLAWYMTHNWLNGFPYNIGFQPALFLLSALLAMVIALVTVILTAMRSARTNPALALHYE
ncbi:MAG: ABC transporter permease [Bacteroidales bacterium]|nr:ABC transporter permease [Bacteroidales bacterium]